MSRPKTCTTCAHRKGFTAEFAHCNFTGTFTSTSRQYGGCGNDFKGWVQREPLFTRIAFAIWKRPTAEEKA